MPLSCAHLCRTPLPRIQMREREEQARQGSDVGDAPVSVELRYAGGKRVAHTVTALPGSSQDPLTQADIQAKWTDCLPRGLGAMSETRAVELFQEGLGFDALADAGKWLVGVAD